MRMRQARRNTKKNVSNYLLKGVPMDCRQALTQLADHSATALY
jgi:hypothetical protein